MDNYDLSKGSVQRHLFRLALPIMASSAVSMSYQLADMFWLGRLGTNEVAAAASTGYVTWIFFAFVLVFRTGTEIGVGHHKGASDEEGMRHYVRTGLIAGGIFGLIFMALVLLTRHWIISFYGFSSEYLIGIATAYLSIVSLGLPAQVLNAIFTGIFTSYGDSKSPFRIQATGLVLNIILDPIFIFGLDLGVRGAALATITAQYITLMLFILQRKKFPLLFLDLHWLRGLKTKVLAKILIWGVPIGLSSLFFSVCTLLITPLVISFGDNVFAAYEIGVQVESIGWLTYSGFSSAMIAFTAQNYGAKQYQRLSEGTFKATRLAVIFSIVVATVLLVGSRSFVGIFLEDPVAVEAGTLYLKIASISQLFSAMEYVATGGLNGLGLTRYPSVNGIIFNALRIPLAYLLSHYFGLAGVFLAITISATLKGIFLYPLYLYQLKKVLRQ